MSNFLKEFSEHKDLLDAVDKATNEGLQKFNSGLLDNDLFMINAIIYKGWKGLQHEMSGDIIAGYKVFSACCDILLAVRLAYKKELENLPKEQQEDKATLEEKIKETTTAFLALEKLFFPLGKFTDKLKEDK